MIENNVLVDNFSLSAKRVECLKLHNSYAFSYIQNEKYAAKITLVRLLTYLRLADRRALMHSDKGLRSKGVSFALYAFVLLCMPLS